MSADEYSEGRQREMCLLGTRTLSPHSFLRLQSREEPALIGNGRVSQSFLLGGISSFVTVSFFTPYFSNSSHLVSLGVLAFKAFPAQIPEKSLPLQSRKIIEKN
jgi:hypothetical protein